MSQSFENTNSIAMERFLRYPGPEQGLDYRVTRLGVIAALRVRGLYVRSILSLTSLMRLKKRSLGVLLTNREYLTIYKNQSLQYT